MSKMMADLNNFSFALYLFQKDYIAAVYFLIYSVLSEYKTKDFFRNLNELGHFFQSLKQ